MLHFYGQKLLYRWALRMFYVKMWAKTPKRLGNSGLRFQIVRRTSPFFKSWRIKSTNNYIASNEVRKAHNWIQYLFPGQELVQEEWPPENGKFGTVNPRQQLNQRCMKKWSSSENVTESFPFKMIFEHKVSLLAFLFFFLRWFIFAFTRNSLKETKYECGERFSQS